jgi:hypothetical protein
MNLDACKIEPVSVSLHLHGCFKLFVRESTRAGFFTTIWGLLTTFGGLASPLADVCEQFLKFVLAKLEAERRLAVMDKVRSRHFAVTVGIEYLAGFLNRESGLVLDSHAALWISLQLLPKFADERVLIVTLLLNFYASSFLESLE